MARIRETAIQKVKLCKIPLCLVKNCSGLKTKFFPIVEKPESASGRIVAIIITIMKMNLWFTCSKKNKAAKIPIARCVLTNILYKKIFKI